MARWKLLAPHYLNVAGTKWEYSEVDRTTGKPKRVQFDVPTLLDPDNPADWNYRVMGMNNLISDGSCIVAWDTGKQEPQDIIFSGNPTPEMEALDAEALAASGKFAERWKRPPEADGGSFGDALIQSFQKKFDQMEAPASARVEGLSEVLVAMTQMMKQNQEMMFLLMGKQLGAAAVVDEEPPLEEVQPTAEEVAAAEAEVDDKAQFKARRV